jgi:prepilin-type N-terminal cleavage/methylation domain-containing protein
MLRRPPAFRPRSTAGFTVLELMVAVAVISIVMALAVPAFQKLQAKSRTAAVVNDFRVFSQAFQTYAVENGGWPPESSVGVMPTGMSQNISSAFTRVTPMGGKYNWENNQLQLFSFRPRAAIAINSASGSPLSLTTNTINMLYALDLAIDNEIGGWNTGHFRLNGNILPLFVVEP